MEIVDKDFKVGYVSGFSMSLKVFRISFMCLFWRLVKAMDFARQIKHTEETVIIEFETSDLKVFWKETIKKAEENPLEALCIGLCERLFTIEETFWAELCYLEKEQESEYLKD